MNARSLHIGLNHVDPAAYGGWDGALAGCINDARDFRRLASGLGYSSTVLTEGQATSHEVLAQLSRAARELRHGDIFLVTYSGHGSQVHDATSDESDRLDETWVLWDREVVDDELYALWGQFEPGVRIVVISDSCHSGTVAKMALYRKFTDMASGSTVDAGGQSSDPSGDPSGDGDMAIRSGGGRTRAMPPRLAREIAERDRPMYDTVQYIAGGDARRSIAASLILISGCQDSQLSYDGDDNGLFTGTFLRVWNEGAFSGSYRSLHRAILAQMPPYQTPNFFTTGSHDPAFEAQRPFAIASPSMGGGSDPQPADPVIGQPSTPPVQTTRPTLRVGDSGEAVRELQQRLNTLGHALVADGFFGRATRGAVIAFQSAQGQVADGIVGEDTWRALLGATGAALDLPTTPGDFYQPAQPTGPSEPFGPVEPGPPPSPIDIGADNIEPPVERPVLRRGDRGEAVMTMQRLLDAHGYHASTDGVFGPRTESLVKSFQRSRGLVADGVVGERTWVALERGRTRDSVATITRVAAVDNPSGTEPCDRAIA